MKTTKPTHAPLAASDVTRDDVHVVTNRCPFCHDLVEVESTDWTSCRSCQARHHEACWVEGSACSSCGETGRLVPEARAHSGALLSGVGIVGSLVALSAGSHSSSLTMLKYSGALGLLGLLVAVVLLVRCLRDLRARADARRFVRHAAWAYAVWGIALANLLLGLSSVWSVITVKAVPPEALAAAGPQLWAGVLLTAFATLPIWLVCLLGLRRAPQR